LIQYSKLHKKWNNMNATSLESLSTNYKDVDIKISKFNDLNRETQEIAFKAIKSLNHSISTEYLETWDKYTPVIIDRLQEHPTSRNTFFVAQDKGSIIGYVAFYTQKDGVPYPNRYIDEHQAYCSWTAVDDSYRRRGLAVNLKLQIFEPEHCVESFKGHIKKTNESSLKVLDKFREKGHKTFQKDEGHRVLYTIHKKV
jgi:hypothetical protein